MLKQILGFFTSKSYNLSKYMGILFVLSTNELGLIGWSE